MFLLSGKSCDDFLFSNAWLIQYYFIEVYKFYKYIWNENKTDLFVLNKHLYEYNSLKFYYNMYILLNGGRNTESSSYQLMFVQG